jgi:8-oxo-dGTP pyrophosphatase MutT (NUDIX family)
MSEEIANPIDAATVVVARDTDSGIEVLMLRRNSRIYFGGMWVFPGGRVDPEDREIGDSGIIDCDGLTLTGFRIAAVREANEEAGIDLRGATLYHFAHWLPPSVRPKRFSTHFFLVQAPMDLGEISIDNGEITEHKWITPAEALHQRSESEIEIVTPTFVTLDWLQKFENVREAINAINHPICFHTHIKEVTGDDPGMIGFYPGDISYETLDTDAEGPRRRCYMLESGWWWEEHDGMNNGPSPKLN